LSRSRKKRTLTQAEKRGLASAGLVVTRYSPDGRARLEQLAPEASGRPSCSPPHRLRYFCYEDGEAALT
jgi:hypothetical protein